MIRIAIALVSAMALSGCASAISELDYVPDWFEAKREGIGEPSYPSIHSASVLQSGPSETPWEDIERDLVRAERDMRRSWPGPIRVTAEEMRAWAAQQRAIVAKGEEPY